MPDRPSIVRSGFFLPTALNKERRLANKNLTLTQVSDVLGTLGYMIALENENLSSEDLYTMTGDLEASIAALLAAAKQKESEGA